MTTQQAVAFYCEELDFTLFNPTHRSVFFALQAYCANMPMSVELLSSHTSEGELHVTLLVADMEVTTYTFIPQQ